VTKTREKKSNLISSVYSEVTSSPLKASVSKYKEIEKIKKRR